MRRHGETGKRRQRQTLPKVVNKENIKNKEQILQHSPCYIDNDLVSWRISSLVWQVDRLNNRMQMDLFY